MRQLMNWLRGSVGVLLVAVLTGCANFYVDSNTKDVETSQFRKTEPPHPVQLLFEFQTKGVANATATALLRPRVFETVKATAVFTDVVETPVVEGALLSISLNNVQLTDDAYSKGFVTGLTLGLAGSQVSDGYVCTINYLPPGAPTPISRKARHAIHTTIGASAAPANGVQAASAEEAIHTVTRQVVSNALSSVTQAPEFK